MEYIWYTILKRVDDFYNITPKYFFKQLEAHKKFNSVKEKDYEKEIIDETCYG